MTEEHKHTLNDCYMAVPKEHGQLASYINLEDMWDCHLELMEAFVGEVWEEEEESECCSPEEI